MVNERSEFSGNQSGTAEEKMPLSLMYIRGRGFFIYYESPMPQCKAPADLSFHGTWGYQYSPGYETENKEGML